MAVMVAHSPLAEQQRIVAKVDALRALGDRPEASLATADTTRCCLFESLSPTAHAVDYAAA